MTLNLPVDRSFRDPIHGFIDIYKHEANIIDDPIFQRLRRIKQLSFGYYVYHGAEHSRFGHSIGAMHVATKALEYIESNTKKFDKKFKLSKQDYLTVRLAALLHDVGHKPFSHALDNLKLEKHEDYSVHLVKKHFAEKIREAGLNPNNVAGLINNGPINPKKSFLADLVSGQLDIDKLDYLLRDSHYAGVKYGEYDLKRLLAALCVKNTDLAVLHDSYYAAIQLVFARYFMNEQVYLHKTKRAYEAMANTVVSYLLENETFDYPRIRDLNKQRKIEKFKEYDDAWFLREIRNTKDRNYRNIAEQIANRKHYEEVCDSFQLRGRILRHKEKDAIEKKMGSFPHASEQMATGFLQALKIHLEENLRSLKINPWEIIFDDYTFQPYKLRPYSRPFGYESSEDPATIRIYHSDSGLLEPIENIHPTLESFARNTPRIMRLFVHRTKKYRVSQFLHRKYKELF